MGLVGQNQQTTFANPQNGQAPDADVIRGNDNAVTTKHNTHDADATIHVQTGLLSARPAAGTAFAMYLDENRRLYVDNGSAWSEVPYARLDASGTNAFANNVTVGGTLGVTGTTTLGTVNAGAVTGTSFTGLGSGLTNLPAGQLTGLVDIARLPSSPAFTGTVGAGSGFNQTGGFSRGHRQVTNGGNTTINAATGNDFRHSTTGTSIITISGMTDGQFIYLEVVNGGGHTVTFAGVTSWGGGNVAPTVTTTAGRKDCFVFKRSGSDTIGFVVDQNFISTS